MHRPIWRRLVWPTILLGLIVAVVAVVTLIDLFQAAQGHYGRPWWTLLLYAALTAVLGVNFTYAVRRNGLWLPSAP